MKISLFYEFPLPRPWSEDDEHQLFQHGLDEVEAADKAGFSTVWLTEHHFLEEYCHSTAPEMFLAAASQRTKDIRLGFGVMHLPPADQPPGPHRRAHRHAGPPVQRPRRVRHRRVVVGRRARRVQHRPGRQARPVGGGPRGLDPLHDRETLHRVQGRARRDAGPQRDPQAAAEAAPAGVGGLHPSVVGADGGPEGHRRTEFRLHRPRAAQGPRRRLLQGVRGEGRARHAGDQPQHPGHRRRPVDDGRPHRRRGAQAARRSAVGSSRSGSCTTT